MKNKLMHILDYLFITRPILFFPGWSTLLIGYLEATREPRVLSRLYPSMELGLVFITIALSMGASFVLNQLADRKTDALNVKCFFIHHDLISRNKAVGYAVFLTVVALAVGYWQSVEIGLVMTLFIFLTGWLYNFHPFALKNRPIGGLAANILMGWLAFVPGWLLLRPFSGAMVVCSLPISFLNTALYLLTTLPDLDGDKATGKKTLAVQLGLSSTAILSVVIFIIGLVISVLISDLLMIAIYAGSAVYFGRIFLRPTLDITIRSTKMTLFLYSLVVCLFFPWYAVLIVMAYFGTRWYYRNRFEVEYPSFGGTRDL